MKKVAQVLLVLFAISACSSSSKHPTVVHHTEPNLMINTDWIEDAGCPLTEYIPGHYSGLCSSESPLLELGCERIDVNHLLGGLPYPVVTCENSGLEPLGTDFTVVGCYLSYRTEAFLTFRDGAYQFIGKEEIKNMSVPIESPDEALSYVLASTNYYAIYDIEVDSYNYYFVNEIKDTFVEETQNGYLVHLFSDLEPHCGCGEHYTDAVDILVDRDGNIKLVKSRHIYKIDACVD
jgi:hypothetical protein